MVFTMANFLVSLMSINMVCVIANMMVLLLSFDLIPVADFFLVVVFERGFPLYLLTVAPLTPTSFMMSLTALPSLFIFLIALTCLPLILGMIVSQS